jgi:drug/metabolite transporter (DMT)-like permease
VEVGALLAGGTAVISGVSVYVNGFAVKQVPDAATYTTLKNGVAFAILLGLVAVFVRPSEVRAVRRRDWGWLTLIGAVGGGAAFLLFFSGLALASAPSAAFIHKTMFVWVALMAGPILGERLGWAQLGALGVLLVGQAVVLPPSGITWGAGETLIALATFLWAVEVIVARRVLGRVRSPIVGMGRLGIGLVVLVGYVALTGRLGGIAAIEPAAWSWILVTGVLLSGYVATWMAALKRAPASLVTSVLVVGAVITGALTALANGTPPAPATIGGYGVIIVATGSLAIVATRRRRAAATETATQLATADRAS